MEMTVHHQNTMCALRLEMGWPSFRPCNDAIGFSAGKEMDFEQGMELARVARMLGKDIIHSSWASLRATTPSSFSVAYREMLSVDIIDRVVPHVANDTEPLALVSIRTAETFAIDRRGSLVRVPGKPTDIRKGRELAMKRIKSRAAAMDHTLLPNNRFVPIGAEWIEPEIMPLETIVRFG